MRSLRILIAFLCLVAVCALLLHAISLEALRVPIDRALTAVVGRPVEIAGPIRIGLLTDLSFDVGDVTVSELPGVARVGRVELVLSPASLLRGQLDVKEVILSDGRVELEGSIAPGAPSGSAARVERPEPEPASGTVVSWHVARVEVRDHLVVHRNRAGLVTTLDLTRLEVEAPARKGPIRAEAAGTFDGLHFDVEGLLGSPAVPEAAGAAYPIELHGSVEQMDFSASGRVDDPGTLGGLDVDVALAASDLSAVKAVTNRRLRALRGLTARARVTNRDGTFGIENAVVTVGGAQDALRVTLTGAIDDLDRLDEIAFRVDLEARDLEEIGALLGVALPPVAGVSLHGEFRGTDESLDSKRFSLRLGQTEVEGRFAASLVPGRRPKLTGSVESAVVHLSDMGLEGRAGASGSAGLGGGGVDLDAPLPLASLPALDAHIAVHAAEVRGRADLLIDDLRFAVALDSTGVAIEDLRVVFADGAVTAKARIRSDTEPPSATLDLDTTAVRVQKVLAQFEQDPSLSGSLDTSVGLVSRGRTLGGLRRNLGGRATLLVTGGATRSAYARSLVFNLRRAVLGPNAPDEFERLECLIGDFQLERGVARVRALWLETATIVIDGSGAIDLGSETFALTFVPKPKQRKLFETTPTVLLSGSFAAPVVTTRTTSLATSAAKGLFSGVTRPLSALLEPVRPLVNPVTEPVLRPMSPILNTFFERQGGERGPCAGYLEARSAAPPADRPPAR